MREGMARRCDGYNQAMDPRDPDDPARRPGDLAGDAGVRADLERVAAASADAVWAPGDEGATPGTRRNIPGLGLVSGDIGPKGQVAHRLREVAREEALHGGRIPYGTSVPGTGRYVIAALLAIVAVAVAILALLAWALS